MSQKMLILSGLPASGKTKYARELMAAEPWWYRVSWDDMRARTPDFKFSRDEKNMQKLSYGIARYKFAQGKNLLIDNTNLHDAAIGKWTRLAGELGIPAEVKEFRVPVVECLRRDALRTGKDRVGPVVINRMALANGLLEFPRTHTAKNLVIVDVDGTLADGSHRRRSKPSGGTDWEYYYRPELMAADKPRFPVVEWVRELYKSHIVLIVSGRPENKAAWPTINWLAANDVPYHHIFMRAGGDFRDDTIVKQEILDKLPKDRIAFCIDDRNRVVDMWRKNKLTCYQVCSREEGEF